MPLSYQEIWDLAVTALGQVVAGLDFQARRDENEYIELGWNLGQIYITQYLADIVPDLPPDTTVDLSINSIVIKKTSRTYPLNTSHGNSILQELAPVTTETVEDTVPILDNVNYYTLFYEIDFTIEVLSVPVPEWTYTRIINTMDFPGVSYGTQWNVSPFNTKYRYAATFDFGDKFYSTNFLPDVYRRKDAEQEDPEYPLKKFLQVMGISFESVRDLLEEHFNVNDPMRIDDALMDHLAWNVGWILNKELPFTKQRLEIRNAVMVYKRKGTAGGLIALIQGLSGWDVYIIKAFKQNILYTDIITSTTIDPTDSDMMGKMGTPEDYVDYIIGGPYTPYGIIIIIEAISDWDLFNRIWAKIIRIIEMWMPICCLAEVIVKTKNPGEGILVNDEHITDYLLNNWLITDEVERVTDEPLWVTPG